MHSMDGWDVLSHAQELSRRGEEFALATVVWRAGPSSGQPSARAVITASGEVYGFIGGACAEPVVVREAQRVIASGEPKLLALGDFSDVTLPEGMVAIAIACQSEGALQVYIEPVIPSPEVLVVGRSPMAHTLVELATALGWRASVHDGASFTAAQVSPRSVVIVATQGHGDEEALEAALSGGRSAAGATAQPAFVGLVASRKRGEAVLGALADRGVPRDLLDRVRVPVGLDLGHTTHREIAVAILAELVTLRAAGELTAAARASLPVVAVAKPEAIDPVCGMTIPADESSRPYEHEGVTYYFCCPGCRRSFERDPAAYLSAQQREARPVRSSLVPRYDAPFPSQEEA